MIALLARLPHGRAQETVQVSTCIVDDGLPDFAEATLESLYENPMTTLLRFRQHYQLHTAATYAARRGAAICALIVFQLEGRSVRVYNEQVEIAADELLRFARAVYQRYPQVDRISFYALDGSAGALPFPHQTLPCLDKITMELPRTPAGYDAILSKNMLSKLKRSNKKLSSDFACIGRGIVEPGDALEDTIRRVVELNRLRMSAKKEASYHTDQGTALLVELVRRYGYVCTVLVDGELRAGAIMMRLGGTVYMHTIAHDPDFNHYNLGTLCCYDSIVHAIRSGAQRYDFGWGPNDYKFRLLGRSRSLQRIDMYRTRLAFIRDAPYLCGRRFQARRRLIKLWLARGGDGDGKVKQTLRHLLLALRAVRERLR